MQVHAVFCIAVLCAAGYVDSLRNSVALDQFNPQFVPNTQPQSTDGELWLVMTIPNVVFSVQLQHSVTVWQEVKFYYICFFNLTMLSIHHCILTLEANTVPAQHPTLRILS